MGTFDWLLNTIDDPGNWGRWIPQAKAANEGGVDLTLPHGTPIYALGDGKIVGVGTFTHQDGSPGYGVLTEQTNVPGLGTANVYYQHIDVLPQFKSCTNGNCNGQTVKRGQMIGYTRSDMYGLEVGINPGWGGIWAGNTAPGPWITDPRPYLKALAQQGGSTTTTTYTPPTCTPPSNPLDVGGGISYAWCQASQTLVSFGEHIAVFLIGLLLIGAGIYLLAHKQINAAVGKAAKGAEVAAL